MRSGDLRDEEDLMRVENADDQSADAEQNCGEGLNAKQVRL